MIEKVLVVNNKIKEFEDMLMVNDFDVVDSYSFNVGDGEKIINSFNKIIDKHIGAGITFNIVQTINGVKFYGAFFDGEKYCLITEMLDSSEALLFIQKIVDLYCAFTMSIEHKHRLKTEPFFWGTELDIELGNNVYALMTKYIEAVKDDPYYLKATIEEICDKNIEYIEKELEANLA
jgi:hypothetical protein